MKIDELERLERAATAPPWEVDDSVGGLGYDVDPVPCGVRKMFEREADARLVAAARNALPALLAVARAAQKWGAIAAVIDPDKSLTDAEYNEALRREYAALQALRAALAALESLEPPR